MIGEGQDATRHRIEWDANVAVVSELGVARLEGVLP